LKRTSSQASFLVLIFFKKAGFSLNKIDEVYGAFLFSI